MSSVLKAIAIVFVFLIFLGLLADSGSFIFSAILLVFLISLVNTLFSKDKKKNTKKGVSRTNDRVMDAQTQPRSSYLSANDRTKVDRALKHYFRTHDRLVITGDINLRPEGGKYTTLSHLMVYEKDDEVAGLEEFREDYGKFYRTSMDLLKVFADADQETENAGEVKPAAARGPQEQDKVQQPAQPEPQNADVTQDAEKYINKINELNDAIPDEEISNGLYQTTAYLTQIKLIEQKFPAKHKQLKKVYNYYLPILVNILEKYKKLQDTASSTDDFKQTADQLTKTIILINGALKQITSSLLEDDLTDLNADMTTLEMLLKSDGMVEEQPLKAGGKKDE